MPQSLRHVNSYKLIILWIKVGSLFTNCNGGYYAERHWWCNRRWWWWWWGWSWFILYALSSAVLEWTMGKPFPIKTCYDDNDTAGTVNDDDYGTPGTEQILPQWDGAVSPPASLISPSKERSHDDRMLMIMTTGVCCVKLPMQRITHIWNK